MVQGCDGYVKKEYRRRGIFLETIKFMEKNLSQNGPEFLMGFNFADSTAAAVKAGSTTVCDVNFWEIEPKDLHRQVNHFNSYSLSEISVNVAQLLYT